ncbi:MAG: hypothetical protein KGI00_00225 [Candidatus Micrarchaeota archaeon]|nr:hypothetical protein [Candidatus Micrarchaeota archaeon]MDE1823964.1 hypothetical protein [Candidatus Micrarchaeota archaeon]MDE1849141.1 hypothetical protein [Candidatus Micrarchaeota archaeon]
MDFLRAFSGANYKESGLGCRCCGYVPSIVPGDVDAICGFCEAYVGMVKSDARALHPEMDMILSSIHFLAKEGEWDDAIALAEQVKVGDEPYLLYGFGILYKAFSDAVYWHVDYNSKGFMEGNAANRNNEPNMKKNNSMHLLEKSKEMLYRSIKLMESKKDDAEILYIDFLANMKLGRRVDAKSALDRLNTVGNDKVKIYANAKYSVEYNTEDARAHLEALAKGASPNSAYYLAVDLARRKRFGESKKMLGILLNNAAMPEGMELLKKIYGLETASGL